MRWRQGVNYPRCPGDRGGKRDQGDVAAAVVVRDVGWRVWQQCMCISL